MHAHFLQHVPFEGLGSIGHWLEERHAVVTATRFFEDAVLPEVDGIELLIVMGGPMSANDDERHPWLIGEKRFIAQAIRRGKSILGVCLGAQLIAAALGARVYPNAEREIGWFPVYSPTVSDDLPVDPGYRFHFPEESLVFHWHGETFDLATGAVHLARSEACANQAFQYGRKVVGLQFHLEMTPQAVRALVAKGSRELTPARWVQPAEQILAVPAMRYAENNGLMAALLSFLTTPEG